MIAQIKALTTAVNILTARLQTLEDRHGVQSLQLTGANAN